MTDSTVTITGDTTIEVVTVGTPGPAGPPGGTGPVSYFHTQGAVSSTWTVDHAMGYRPNVTVFNSANDMVEGSVTHVDVNQLTISFSSAFSGYAVLS